MVSPATVTLALGFLLPKRDAHRARRRRAQAVALLAAAAAVLRAELALLLAAVGLQLVATRRMGARRLAGLVAGAGAGAVAVSAPLDSYLWQRPVWPELAAFHFNAVRGAASRWGVAPWHHYWTSALPRLLLNPLALPLVACALAAPATRRAAAAVALAPLLFVAAYSLQPHKEARFVLYAVPPLTAAAALAASRLAARRAASLAHAVAALAVAASLAASLAAALAMLLASSLNYPGGDALVQLRALVAARPGPPAPVLAVHADVLTCMTGLTLFGQNPDGLPLGLARDPADLAAAAAAATAATGPVLLFDRTEDAPLLARPSFWQAFDYALVEDPAAALGPGWRVVGVVHGYDGVEVLAPRAAPRYAAGGPGPPVLGRALALGRLRDAVRRRTGGWWVGPRTAPRVHIMQRAAP